MRFYSKCGVLLGYGARQPCWQQPVPDIISKLPPPSTDIDETGLPQPFAEAVL